MYTSFKESDFDFNPEVKKVALNYALTKKLIEKEIIPDEIDSIIPGKSGNIIKLPELDIKFALHLEFLSH